MSVCATTFKQNGVVWALKTNQNNLRAVWTLVGWRMLEAIATRLEAIALRLEAIASSSSKEDCFS